MRYWCLACALVIVVSGLAPAWAQGPSAPPPTCEENLNNEMFQKGGVIQQLAVARAQLAQMTKERDEAKAALAKVTPKPAATPEKK